MDSNQMLMMLPGMQPAELQLVQELTRDMTDGQQRQFISIYSGNRKDKQTMLIFTIIGFVGVAGIQRFVVGQVGLGILYFFTGGLCLIGTIVDLVNIDQITNDFNNKKALEAANMVRMMVR